MKIRQRTTRFKRKKYIPRLRIVMRETYWKYQVQMEASIAANSALLARIKEVV